MTDPRADESLLMRLRDLALVELDALLAGVPDHDCDALLTAHAAELDDALRAVRVRANELVRLGATDPLTWLDAGAAVRARDGGRDAAERVGKQLRARAAAARALARLDDMTAMVYPRLIEIDRRRAGVVDP